MFEKKSPSFLKSVTGTTSPYSANLTVPNSLSFEPPSFFGFLVRHQLRADGSGCVRTDDRHPVEKFL
jgi:hypothetical protein